jgi:hypothetical protein
MPGRPRTTLKRLDELRQQALAYGSALFELMPDQYHEHPDSTDPTSVAWWQAAHTAMDNCRSLGSLREVLSRKVERAERRNGDMASGRS